MLKWKFKCRDCDYKFSAMTSRALFDNHTRCLMCGSENIQKDIEVSKKKK